MNIIWKLVAFVPACAASLLAQSFTTIYEFQGYDADLAEPAAAMIRTANGHLFGTGYAGGVFELTPPSSGSPTWTETLISQTSANYWSGVTLGTDGNLYGTESNGPGAVYQLVPPKKKGASWTLNYIHYFSGGIPPYTGDGGYPQYGVMVAPNGVIYGTTSLGGAYDNGTVFELTPPPTPRSTWTETILYSFPTVVNNGGMPHGNLTLGPDGSLYGNQDGQFGLIYHLTPPSTPGGAWTYNTIYSFTGTPNNDGTSPIGTLALGPNGVLYGVTIAGGPEDDGTVFSLTPPAAPGGSWTESVLYDFPDPGGYSPSAGPIIGSTRALYGVTQFGPYKDGGTVWALDPPASSGGAWTFHTLHRFATHQGDIQGGLTLGPNNTLYGVTTEGGSITPACSSKGCGTVFEITH